MLQVTKVFKLVALVLLILEGLAFIAVAQCIGVGFAILLLLALSGLGMAILRGHMRSAMDRLQQKFARGISLGCLWDAPLVLGGVLLVIPGFITASLGGICLLLSGLNNFKSSNAQVHSPASAAEDPNIIEGEFKRENNPR